MVDSIQPNSSDPILQHEDDEHCSSLSSTIEKCIGELNWTQFLQAILVSFAWFFDGQQTFITIFTDASPSWHCTNESCNSSTTSNICNLPKDSWAWDGPTQTSIISEWALVWLLIKGRKEEALEILKIITSINHNDLNLAMSSMSLEGEVWNVDLYSALKIMMQKKWSSRRILTIVTMGSGIGLVYYGMPLGLEILSFNLYLSVTFNALAEIPSTLLTYVLLDKFNRRSVLFLLTIISGVTSVLAIMEGKIMTRLEIVFELISFFCACTAYDVVLIYTTELFPSCVRNSAISLVRQAVALGGAIGPVLVVAGRENKFICYGVFGLAIGCSGVFVVCLPETKGKAFCDTMDEEESKEDRVQLLK
ncbi:MFS transporter superfamily [Sesbania bispinosa]|nr:MFS transporter superfamily [Sesbania bispinosa]